MRSSSQGPPAPWSPGPASPAGRPRRAPSRRRLFASLALLVAGIFLAAATVTPWWELEVSEGGATGVLAFLPGTSLYGAGGGNSTLGSYSGEVTYQAAGYGALAALYETLLGLVAAAAVLALLGGAIALAAERHWLRGPRARGSLPTILALVSALIALSALVMLPTAQPAQFNAANPGQLCSEASSSAISLSTPCNSFWGSLSGSGTTIVWGSGFGWDIAVLAFILLLVGAWRWRSGTEDDWEEDTTVAPWTPGPIPPSGSAPPPPPRYTAGLPPPPTLAARPPAPTRPASPPGAMPVPTPPPPRTGPPPVGAPPRPPSGGPPVGPRAAAGPLRSPPARPPAAGAPPARPPYAPYAPPGAPTGPPGALPPRPAASPPVRPPPAGVAADAPGSEVAQIAAWKRSLDAGTLTPDQFRQAKAQLLAQPISAAPEAPATPGRSPLNELVELNRLRDAQAVSGPEYLELRRRIILRP